MAVPNFNAYKEDESFNKDNKNIDTLYASYVQWLINRKNKTASISELLLQLNIISAFLVGKVKTLDKNGIRAINEPINTIVKKHHSFRVNPTDQDSFAIIVFFAVVCGIVGAALIGASFAPSLSGRVFPLRFFGAVMGIDFVGLISVMPFYIQRVTKYGADTTIVFNEACNKISQQISPVTDIEVNPALQSVRATLLTACTYNDGYSPKESIHSDTAADNMFVNLEKLRSKLRH